MLAEKGGAPGRDGAEALVRNLATRGRGGASIALSWGAGFGALARMDATDAEKANARRVQRLLYGLMMVMIGVPLIIFVVRLF